MKNYNLHLFAKEPRVSAKEAFISANECAVECLVSVCFLSLFWMCCIIISAESLAVDGLPVGVCVCVCVCVCVTKQMLLRFKRLNECLSVFLCCVCCVVCTDVFTCMSM